MSNPLVLGEQTLFKSKRGRKMPFNKPPKVKGIDPAAEVASTVQGQKASSYEAFVAWALDKLGARYTFQHAIGGGRGVRGGQMLDFVVWGAITWVIDVRGGYWHRGDELDFERAVRRYMKNAHVLVMLDKDCVTKETALSFLKNNGVG